MALILLALVANLVTGGKITAEGKWEWILAGTATFFGVVINLLGIRFVTKIRAKRERSSLLWARRGFVVGLILTLLVAADVFLGTQQNRQIPHLWMGGVLMFGLNASPFFFLLAFQRDASRLVARTGVSRRRSSGGSD